MIIKNSGYRSWRNMISSGNRSKFFVEVFQILQNIMHSKDRYFLGFEDKRIEFIIGLSTTWTFVASCPVFYYAFLLIGVIVPLIGGYATAMFFNRPGVITSDASCSVFLQNIFIGVILTATSVSITVETLKELGKLKTKSGNAILGAAIIDDVLGIVALTLVTSMADESVKISVVLLKIVAFFAFAGVIGFIFYKVFKKWTDQAEKQISTNP